MSQTPAGGIDTLVNDQAALLDDARKKRLGNFLECVIQLCHMDTSLAEKLWLELFPRMWSILSDRQRTVKYAHFERSFLNSWLLEMFARL